MFNKTPINMGIGQYHKECDRGNNSCPFNYVNALLFSYEIPAKILKHFAIIPLFSNQERQCFVRILYHPVYYL